MKLPHHLHFCVYSLNSKRFFPTRKIFSEKFLKKLLPKKAVEGMIPSFVFEE